MEKDLVEVKPNKGLSGVTGAEDTQSKSNKMTEYNEHSASDKSIRVISFNGKQAEWAVWETKFLAKANRRGFKKVLLGIDKVPKDSEEIDLSDDEGKKKQSLREANERLYEELLLSIDGNEKTARVAFNLVKLAKTKDLADGDASLAWKRLKEKYATKSTQTLLRLKKKFVNSKLELKTDPEEWITDLEDLRAQMMDQDYIMDEKEFHMHILNNLPDTYEIVQRELERKLDEDLSTVEIQTELKLKFQRMHPNKVDDENEDVGLFAGGFKGHCHNCGQQGHKSTNCPDRKENTNYIGGKRFRGKCYHCGKTGHKKSNCWDLHGKPDQANVATTSHGNAEVTLCMNEVTMKAKEMNMDEWTWIGDSGASCHMTNNDTGMYEVQTIQDEITIGNGKPLIATKIGKLKVDIMQKDGSSMEVTLTGVKYVPNLFCKLFSITKALEKGLNIGNDGKQIYLKTNNFKLTFDQVFNTATGYILGIKMVQQARDISQLNLESGKAININRYHELLGHVGIEALKNTANKMDLKLTGKFIKCEDCALSKVRQKNLNKDLVPRATKKGERFFMDISSIKYESLGKAKFWLLLIDDATDYCFSFFMKQKSDLSKTVRDLVSNLKAQQDIKVGIIHCDNASENKKLETDSKKDGLGLIFEYTAPNTPQQNGRVERKFATLYGRVRSMLNWARLTKDLRGKMWAETANTATDHEAMIVYPKERMSSFEKFFGKEAPYARCLRTFGEMAIIKNHEKIKGKLTDRGKVAMFLGYPKTSSTETFRFLNLKTMKIVLSRDVIWINKNYGSWKGLTSTSTTLISVRKILVFVNI